MATIEPGVAGTGSENAGIRQRYVPDKDSEWNPSLPYGGKVYLARKKKQDPYYVTAIEVISSRYELL